MPTLEEMANVLAQRYQPLPLGSAVVPNPSFLNNFPTSTNIDDRRNESTFWPAIASALRGDIDPETFSKMLRHPLTPFQQLRPQTGGADPNTSSLATQAGLDDLIKLGKGLDTSSKPLRYPPLWQLGNK